MSTKVIETIRKLLALAAEDSGGTEHERNLAAEKAQELMLKHRIDEAELAKSEGRHMLSGIERRYSDQWHFAPNERWRGMLLSVVGDQVEVDALHQDTEYGYEVHLVGRPESMDYVSLMYDWLIPQLASECTAAAKVHMELFPEWMFAKAQRDKLISKFEASFYDAAVIKIGARLYEARKAKEGFSTDLVLHESKAKEDFYDAEGEGPPREEEWKVVQGAGTEGGLGAGGNVDIDPTNKVGDGERLRLEEPHGQ